MYSKNNKKMNDQKQLEKVNQYGIKKFNVGTASVLVAAGFAFLGGGNALASNDTAVNNANEPATPAATATAKEEAPAPTVAKANKANLSAAIARVQNAIAKAAVTEKTSSAIEEGKAELANAQALEASETATQGEVDKATVALKNRAFVLESMPKATADKKEEKVNKNQDSRNGQAIPGQGESGFRAVDTTAANSAAEAAKYKAQRDNALPELQANIDKIQAQIAKEEALPANKKDQFKIDVLKGIKQKAENVITTANAADATSAQKMSQQAEAVKSERDLLASYLSGKTELGAPISENHVAYGNNPENGVFESLKEGFGDKVTFTDADKKSETIAKQYESGRDITNKVNNKPDAKDPIGSATYNWQEKTITKADAEAGMLNGWKIEKGDKVNAVKPLDVTNVTDKDGQPSTREVPKSKIYSNDGELKKYQTSGENSYVNGSGAVPSVTPTIDVMRTNAFGEVKNRDYYLELGSKGTTLSKEFDVNGNSRLNVNLIHSAAYGGSTATSAGERVKLTIVDAFTGKEIKPVEGKNGPLTTEQAALAANGWNHLDRIYDIPAETTKIKVLIEAGSQGTNTLINDNNINIKDGYLIGGIGIATAPAAEVVTNVRSDGKTGEYGYTKDTIYEKGQKGNFDITIKNTGGMNIDYYAASNVEVTVEVPKGVVLEDKIYNANGGSNWLGNVWANTIKWVPNDPSDNSKGGKLTYNVPAGNRMAAAEKNSRTTSIPFTAADNFVGPADFKVTVKSGFGDTDAEGNRLYSYTANGLKPPYENEFNRNGLADSDNPDYKYGKVIFINSLQTNSVITVPINTTDEQLKAIAYKKAQEAIKSPEFTKLLTDVTGTATLGDKNGSTFVNKDDIAITKVAEDGRGVVKVPVTYTVDGKTYETTVDIEVNVVESKTKPVVVFEGDEITPANVKEKVEPSEIDGKKGTANEPKSSDIFKTDGKAGESGLKIPTTVTHNVDGTPVTEDVTVPVTVLPRTQGEVDVPKGTSPDKVKDTLKAKAEELIKTPDFPAKVPEGYTVTVGEIPELPADIANKKGEPVVVKVPVTFTSPDGTTYTSDIPVTVNVKGSEVKPVYVVEGNQPKPADVNEAITPDKGGDLTPVTEADINKDVPTDKVKVGATDLAVKATVKYPTGDETVDVPVKVLPKATPTGVTVLKDTDDKALTDAVKEKANEAVSKLTNLPEGITASLDERETSYTLPKTDSNGDKDTVPVKVLYKDAKGNVVGEDTIKVPVKVVSSTPKPVVVFEGDKPTKAKDSVTPGEGGTVGEPSTLPETAGKAGADDVSVDVPVTYDNGKVTETVKVPVTVLPKATADVTVAKNTTPDKLKELAKDKAKEAVEATDFKSKLPKGATVTVGDVTEEVLAKLTAEKGTNTGTVNVPVTYTVDEKDYTTTIPVAVNVKGSDVKPVYVVEGDKPKAEDVNKSITPDTDGTATPVTDEDINKAIPTTEGKVGSKDVKVTTKVTYPNNVEEPITVPVTVLPKVKPEGVTVPKDADKTELAKVVKEKAEEAAKKLNGLPDGVTVTVTNVETTPGTDKTGVQTPATVTVEYKDKDGNKITKVIEVPVNVVSSTPPAVVVFEGDTPNSEDVKKGIEPGKGGTVGDPTKVPSTVGKAGDKDVEVEVPVTYDNGKFKENVKVPVTVLPKPKAGEVIVPKDLSEKELKEKVGKDAENAINNEEFKKKLPEGATVKVDLTNVTLPKTSTPGKAGEVEVPVIYTVNGKEYKTTVKVPVTVVEGKEQLVPKGDKPDPKDNITPGNYPEGSTFEYETPVDTSKPGKKEAVVIVKDKDGKEIVRVPVVVNVVEPKVTPIIVPERTKLTKKDVEKHIEIPGVTGWEIVGEPELPETFPAGVRPSATVTVKLPNGKTMKVQVPVIATPTVTPIVVPQGTTITPDDVKKHVNIPKESGWEIIEVGEIPTTETPGDKTSVKVKVKLPTGEVIELEVPVKVTPKETPAPTPTVKTTPIVVEVGTPITEDDVKKHVELPNGAQILEVGKIPTTESAGQKPSVKVKVKLPSGEIIEVEVPVTVTPKHVEPSTPAGPTTPEQPQGENGNKPQPETPAKPEKPSENTKPEAPKAPVAKAGEKVLPNTGIADNNSALAGLGLAILGLAAAARRRKQK
ncbi:MAG: Rib/alpha-like domain-containing protein [Gemella haemolysans]|uniref:Rib/alpha-like domain-containing protein n=1 Tax=Gemella haemolysans TaxID=1379 RepID=UPI00290E52B8|nr:Rib/alpha-like domain-containing protein [Gemella haemolysans]MDU4714075.1 Rib/alpha-like domain-containing protein [Gemella haemolysans]